MTFDSRSLVRVLVVVSVLATSASEASAQEVGAGYDLFTTDAGTTDLFGIPFEGLPLTPPIFDFTPPPASADGTRAIGDTDTIVHRLEPFDFSAPMPSPISIELVVLSLQSQSMLDTTGDGVPDSFVYVTLQKDRTPGESIEELHLPPMPGDPPDPSTFSVVMDFDPSLGTMDISLDMDGGDFSSEFTVFADLRRGSAAGQIVCGGPLPPCSDFSDGLELVSEDAEWSRNPLPDSIQIRGVDHSLAAPDPGDPEDLSSDFWPGVSAMGGVFVCVSHGGHPDPGGKPTAHGTCRTSCTTEPAGVGTGCDGVDNDCNGIIDDCAEDETGPRIMAPESLTFECPYDRALFVTSETGLATGTDDCNEPVLPQSSIRFEDFLTPLCGNAYRVDRIWTGVDSCGNDEVSPGLQQFFVLDTTPPVIIAPRGLVLDCNDSTDPAETGRATATDGCTPGPVISFVDTVRPGRCPQEMFIFRLWIATDACGNTASCEQVLVIQDTTPPELDCPADMTVECDQPNDPFATGVATATDDCENDTAIVFCDTVTAGDCDQEYTITRLWTATDQCGNSTDCVQTIEVVDTTPPEPVAVLVPAVPLPPSSPASAGSPASPRSAASAASPASPRSAASAASPASPRSAASARSPASPRSPGSACSPRSRRAFRVECSATDNCDPGPLVSAVLLVTRDACLPIIEEIPVVCGEIVELRLVPPGAADPPCSVSALSFDSKGVKIVTGQEILLEVTAVDDCGNVDWITFNPEGDCEDELPLGPCPCILQPGDAAPPRTRAKNSRSLTDRSDGALEEDPNARPSKVYGDWTRQR